MKKLYKNKIKVLLQIYHFLEFYFYKSFCGIPSYFFLLELSIPVIDPGYNPKYYNYFSLVLWIFVLSFCFLAFFLKKIFLNTYLKFLFNRYLVYNNKGKSFFSLSNYRVLIRFCKKIPPSGEFLCALLISTCFTIIPLFL